MSEVQHARTFFTVGASENFFTVGPQRCKLCRLCQVCCDTREKTCSKGRVDTGQKIAAARCFGIPPDGRLGLVVQSRSAEDGTQALSVWSVTTRVCDYAFEDLCYADGSAPGALVDTAAERPAIGSVAPEFDPTSYRFTVKEQVKLSRHAQDSRGSLGKFGDGFVGHIKTIRW